MSQLQRHDIDGIIARLEPAVQELGCELLDIRWVAEGFRQVLRLYIDKPGGVNVDDCARVSHAVEDLIEVEGYVSDAYHLEVSSPGVERPLRTSKHFEDVVGQQVLVTTAEKIDGRRRYKGKLKKVDVDAEGPILRLLVDGSEYVVPIRLIEKAHLVHEWKSF